MTETDKHKLLAEFARCESEIAFATLVGQHVNLVYSTALRFTGNPHHAEEITQSVFITLARKAGTFSPDVVLSGWLYQTARLTAANFMKSEIRRQQREQEAYMQSTVNEPDAAWTQIAPLLDEAMGGLGETDRTAVVLRYFENKTAAEVATALKTTEAAAHKRISRALEKLRQLFSKRDVTLTTALIAGAVSANSVHAAPTGLAVKITTAAIVSGTALTTATIATTTKAIAMTALQKTIVTATVAVLAGVGIYEAHQTAQLREQVHTLQQEQSPLTAKLQEFQRERDELAARLSTLADELEKKESGSSELLRLRGEVARLRSDSRELAVMKAAEAGDPAQAELKSWLARVKQLKQEFENNPQTGIPELSLLGEQEWLDAARLFGKRSQFDAATDLRVTMAQVRQSAQNKFADIAQPALARYVGEHGQRWPADIAELKPHFPIAIDDKPFDVSILDRYKIVPAETVRMSSPRQPWVLTQKELIDDEYDRHIGIGPADWGYGQTHEPPPDVRELKLVLGPAAKEFSAANGGREPTDPSELAPYLKTDEQRLALQKIIELRDSSKRTNQ